MMITETFRSFSCQSSNWLAGWRGKCHRKLKISIKTPRNNSIPVMINYGHNLRHHSTWDEREEIRGETMTKLVAQVLTCPEFPGMENDATSQLNCRRESE